MACLDQNHSGKEGHAIVVVEDLPISDLDYSSNLDCICCLKGHNYSVVVGFVLISLLISIAMLLRAYMSLCHFIRVYDCVYLLLCG